MKYTFGGSLNIRICVVKSKMLDQASIAQVLALCWLWNEASVDLVNITKHRYTAVNNIVAFNCCVCRVVRGPLL